MGFGTYYRQWKLERKIWFRLHYRYPEMFPGSRVLSILPLPVEKMIGAGTVIEENVRITPNIKSIGRYLYIGRNTTISNCESIGSFCSISADVKIGLMSHPKDFISTSPLFYAKRRGWVKENTYAEDENKSTVIGHDVLLSAGVMVRNGVTIGHGAIIGAGSFVSENIPPYAIAVGSPARVTGYRFDEALIARLLESKWWEYSDGEIRAAGNFNDPVKFLDALQRKTKA